MLFETLSLGTFEPTRADAPYLNTPRSLEACRLNGVNPVELVEVPLDEFRKDFPNDLDAAQRRYERVDGARRRILNNVLADWKQLCDIGWKPKKDRPKSAKETIIPVEPEAHCELLEIQAEMFRKIERDQMGNLRRLLHKEIKHAVDEQRHQEILNKHEEIKAKSDDNKKERQQHKEELHRKHIEYMKKKEEERQAEIKKFQLMESEMARQKKIDDEIKAKRQKRQRENLETQRVMEAEETRAQKERILKDIALKTEQRKQMLAFRDQEAKLRQDQVQANREKHKSDRGNEVEQRLKKAKDDMENDVESRRVEILRRMEEDERKRKELKERKERQRQEELRHSNDAMLEKLNYAKKCAYGGAEERALKIKAEMDFKDMLAKQELNKVKDSQEKRRAIKLIRQEAYELANLRRQKMDEHRRAKLDEALKNKEDRCNAIKQGYTTLKTMRRTMKDIIIKATTSLKDEIHGLAHRGELSPDRVIHKAVEVTDHVLFPHLQRKFGTVDKFDDSALAAFMGQNTSESAGSADALGRASTAPQNTIAGSLDEGLRPTTGADKSKSQGMLASRSTKGTLKLKVLTKDTLVESLVEGKVKIVEAAMEEDRVKALPKSEQKKGRTGSPSGAAKRSSAANNILNQSSSSASSSSSLVGGSSSSIDAGAMSSLSPSGSKMPSISSGKNRLKPVDRSPQYDDDDEQIFPVYDYSINDGSTVGGSQKGSKAGTGSKHKQEDKPGFRPLQDGEFRREFSSDHPLAGGKGQYKRELAAGKKLAGVHPGKKEMTIERLTIDAQVKIVDPQRQLEILRREQNDALMRVLEDERFAEDSREKALLQLVGDDEETTRERAQLELIFSDERKRASERIVRLTKEHETRIKEAVLTLANMNNDKKKGSRKPLAS